LGWHCLPHTPRGIHTFDWQSAALSAVTFGLGIAAIDSVGHGIETVTVTKVGTQAARTALTADASAGATRIQVRGVNGFVAGGVAGFV